MQILAKMRFLLCLKLSGILYSNYTLLTHDRIFMFRWHDQKFQISRFARKLNILISNF